MQRDDVGIFELDQLARRHHLDNVTLVLVVGAHHTAGLPIQLWPAVEPSGVNTRAIRQDEVLWQHPRSEVVGGDTRLPAQVRHHIARALGVVDSSALDASREAEASGSRGIDAGTRDELPHVDGLDGHAGPANTVWRPAVWLELATQWFSNTIRGQP